MDPRIEGILNEARRLDGDARTAYIRQACGGDADLLAGVEAMLRAGSAAGESPGAEAETIGIDRSAPVSGEQPGLLIDRYRLVRKIGEGGFGSVWLAEQTEPIRREVALKVIKLGMDTRQVISRFEAERQTLAMMDHPNIARVFDAGSTGSGRPYFVMELVQGMPILEYCDSRRLAPADRLDLFMDVCRAIQHAHQKGIIHRDIKPSNVLVGLQDGRPVPKVIDFGIAKATETELVQKTVFTEHHQVIGTPAYMSPEQAGMTGLDIDTRSDIYSLGVLLYELLTGTTPFDTRELLGRGFAEMMRVIRDEEPHRPSTRLSELGERAGETARLRRTDARKLRHFLHGDLDWIVMKCLEKDRTRRYESAAGLAEDITRHLGNEPVIAGPPSAGYRMRKFVRRNRGRVVAASVVAAALVLGVVGTSVGLAWALREKERALEAEARAEQRAEELEQVSAFQASQLSDIDTALMGISLRQDVLGRRREASGALLADEAGVEAAVAALEASLAGVNFTDIALHVLDEHVFGRALEALDARFGDQPLLQARLLQTVASTMRELGLNESATSPQSAALDIRRRILGDDDPETLLSRNEMCWLLRQQGRFAEAETCLKETLADCRRILGDLHRETLKARLNSAALHLDMGRFADAEPLVRETLAASTEALGPADEFTLSALYNLGFSLFGLGRLDEAEQCWREVVELRRRKDGDEHPRTLTAISSLGHLLTTRGRHDEALALADEALELSRSVYGNEHWSTLNSVNHKATVLLSLGRPVDAEPYFREALQVRRRVLGENHASTLTSINNMGQVLHRQGRLAEAKPYYLAALEGNRRVHGDGHANTLVAVSNMGGLMRELGELADADRYGAEAVEAARRALGTDHWQTALFLTQHAQTLMEMKRFEEAETRTLEALSVFPAVLGDTHQRTREAMNQIVRLYELWHSADPGAGHDVKAASWRERAGRD